MTAWDASRAVGGELHTNGKVGSAQVESVVGKWCVKGEDENGECLVDFFLREGFILSKHLLQTQVYS